jgi:glutathione S-transferase
MQPEELCLYVDARFISPYGLSAFVAMHEKGLRFEVRTVDLLANQQQGSGYAASSLTRRVPTLIHKGFALSESSAIAEYVISRPTSAFSESLRTLRTAVALSNVDKPPRSVLFTSF